MFNALVGVEDVPDRLFIDSTCIMVHRTARGAKGEPWPIVSAQTRGGRDNQLHAICDVKSRPRVLLLIPGNGFAANVTFRFRNAPPPGGNGNGGDNPHLDQEPHWRISIRASSKPHAAHTDRTYASIRSNPSRRKVLAIGSGRLCVGYDPVWKPTLSTHPSYEDGT